MGSGDFFGGLLEGLGSGLLNNEKRQQDLKAKDIESRRRAAELIYADKGSTPDQKAGAIKVLVAPSIYRGQGAHLGGGGGLVHRGDQTKKQQAGGTSPSPPTEEDIINKLFDPIGSSGGSQPANAQPQTEAVGTGSQVPPPTPKPLPTATPDFPNTGYGNEARMRVQEDQAKADIKFAEDEREFQAHKKRVLEDFPKGSPEYFNSLYGINVSTKPESIDQSMAESLKKHQSHEMSDDQFKAFVGDVHELMNAKQKPGSPKELWSKDPSSASGFKVDFINPVSGQVVSSAKDRLPPAGYLPTEHNQIMAIPDPNDPTKTIYQSVPITSAKVIPGAKGRGANQGTSPKPTAGSPTPPIPKTNNLPGKTIGGGPSKATQASATKIKQQALEAQTLYTQMQGYAKRGDAGDAIADRALIAAHLAMTNRAAGMRPTGNLLKDAETARSAGDSMSVVVQKFLTGASLTSQQRQEMVSNAKIRLDAIQQEFQQAQAGGGTSGESAPSSGAKVLVEGKDF
jgi:hypothetical protein